MTAATKFAHITKLIVLDFAETEQNQKDLLVRSQERMASFKDFDAKNLLLWQLQKCKEFPYEASSKDHHAPVNPVVAFDCTSQALRLLGHDGNAGHVDGDLLEYDKFTEHEEA